ncbi:MAG: hypothetical protein P8X89_01690 [Reinekea sp.]
MNLVLRILVTTVIIISNLVNAQVQSGVEGSFERTRYDHIIWSSIGDQISNTGCKWLKVSPNGTSILIACYDRSKELTNAFSLVIIDRTNDQFVEILNTPSKMVDWITDESLVFVHNKTIEDGSLFASILNLEDLSITKFKLLDDLTSDAIGPSRFEHMDYKDGYVYIVEDEGITKGVTKFAVQLRQPHEYVTLDGLQEIDCLYNFCYGDMSFEYDAATKRILLFPLFREPFKNRLALRNNVWANYDLNEADITGNVGAYYVNNGTIVIADYSEIFTEYEIDGWESLNLIKGNISVIDDTLLFSSAENNSTDTIDIWLHTQREESERRVNGPGTYRFSVDLAKSKLYFRGKGRYNEENIMDVQSQDLDAEVSVVETSIGYQVEVQIPKVLFLPLSRTLYYQLNVIDHDGDGETKIISSNTNLRRYFEADVSIFNKVELPE